VKRSGDASDKILDCMPQYQIVVLRNVRHTGTAKLPARTFATCKRITSHKRPLKWEKREKSWMSLVPRYATIVKDLNVVNSGAKPGVLPLNLRFFVPFWVFRSKIW